MLESCRPPVHLNYAVQQSGVSRPACHGGKQIVVGCNHQQDYRIERTIALKSGDLGEQEGADGQRHANKIAHELRPIRNHVVVEAKDLGWLGL